MFDERRTQRLRQKLNALGPQLDKSNEEMKRPGLTAEQYSSLMRAHKRLVDEHAAIHTRWRKARQKLDNKSKRRDEKPSDGTTMGTIQLVGGVVLFFVALIAGMVGILGVFMNTGSEVPVIHLVVGISGTIIAAVMVGVFCGRNLGR